MGKNRLVMRRTAVTQQSQTRNMFVVNQNQKPFFTQSHDNRFYHYLGGKQFIKKTKKLSSSNSQFRNTKIISPVHKDDPQNIINVVKEVQMRITSRHSTKYRRYKETPLQQCNKRLQQINMLSERICQRINRVPEESVQNHCFRGLQQTKQAIEQLTSSTPWSQTLRKPVMFKLSRKNIYGNIQQLQLQPKKQQAVVITSERTGNHHEFMVVGNASPTDNELLDKFVETRKYQLSEQDKLLLNTLLKRTYIKQLQLQGLNKFLKEKRSLDKLLLHKQIKY